MCEYPTYDCFKAAKAFLKKIWKKKMFIHIVAGCDQTLAYVYVNVESCKFYFIDKRILYATVVVNKYDLRKLYIIIQ